MSRSYYETERLILKPTEISDDAVILGVLNSPKFLEFVGDRNVRTLNDARQYIVGKIRPQIDKLGYGSFTLIRKEDQLKIGVCGLYDRPGVNGIDLGFGLLPQFEGLGFGSEAAARVLKLAFNDFGLREVKAITSKQNSGSQKVLEKMGFERDGYITLPDAEEVLLQYTRSSTNT